MEPQTIARPLALLSALTALFVAPSPTPTSSIGASIVCAAGTCCPEPNSTCNAGGPTHLHYYYLSTGACGGS